MDQEHTDSCLAYNSQIDELRKELDESENILNDSEKKLKESEKSVEVLTKAIKDLENHNKSLEKEQHNQKDTFQSEITKQNTLEQLLHQKESDILKLRNNINETYEHDRKDADNENDILVKQIQEKNAARDAELEAVKGDLEKLQDELGKKSSESEQIKFMGEVEMRLRRDLKRNLMQDLDQRRQIKELEGHINHCKKCDSIKNRLDSVPKVNLRDLSRSRHTKSSAILQNRNLTDRCMNASNSREILEKPVEHDRWDIRQPHKRV